MDAAIIPLPNRHVGAAVDCHRQNETFVVVSVLPDKVDAARG